MKISHAESRSLIQYSLDRSLNTDEQKDLFVHLQACTDCTAYAAEIKDLENNLLSTMKKHWNLAPSPLAVEVITGKRNRKSQTAIFVKLAMAGAVLILFVYGTWQFTETNNKPGVSIPLEILPIPTPSIQMTNTDTLSLGCKEIRYIVQNGDTVESIAIQFSISLEELMKKNNLTSGLVIPGIEIVIPLCDTTPSKTIRPPTTTTTYTPTILLTAYIP